MVMKSELLKKLFGLILACVPHYCESFFVAKESAFPYNYYNLIVLKVT